MKKKILASLLAAGIFVGPTAAFAAEGSTENVNNNIADELSVTSVTYGTYVGNVTDDVYGGNVSDDVYGGNVSDDVYGGDVSDDVYGEDPSDSTDEESAVSTEGQPLTWIQNEGKWYLYDEYGYLVQGDTYKINNKWYYFDGSGVMAENGWVLDRYTGTYYFAKADGSLLASTWYKNADGKWYYFNQYAEMETGWVFYGGQFYYLAEEDGKYKGSMQTGWIEDKEVYGDEEYVTWYYAGADGVLYQYKWLQYGGKWYFFDHYGEMATGFKTVGNTTYYFDKNGVMQTGWIADTYENYDGELKTNWYYAKSNGALVENAWLYEAGNWYFLNWHGLMATGLYTVGGQDYVFHENGALAKGGWVKDEGTWYYSDANGIPYKYKWISYGGKWYFLSHSGSMITDGMYTIGAHDYYFDETGVMLTGWIKIEDYYGDVYWTYAKASGEILKHKWIKTGGVWYYVDLNGWMVSNQTAWVGGVLYYFDETGALLEKEGWVEDDYGYSYYVNADGSVKTGAFKVNGEWYYTNPYDGSVWK